MAPGPFDVGIVSQLGASALSAILAAYALLTGRFTWRAFRAGLEDRWSALVATATMAALAVAVAVFGPTVFPAPFSIWAAGVAIIGVAITVTYTLARLHERIESFQAQFGERLDQLLAKTLPEDRLAELRRLQASWADRREERRKTPHLLMALYLLFYGLIGYLFLRAVWSSMYGGSPGTATGEGVANLYAATHAEVGTYLVAGQQFGLFMLFGLLFLIAPNEMMRLRFPETGYPFKSILLANLRDKEAGLFGAHYYIAAALPLAAIWVARDPAQWSVTILALLGIISVTVFADSASALVGVRFGKRPLPTNPAKTVAGTVGGAAVAFVVAVPFVGWTVGVASALVFAVLDIVGPKPIPVSDNLLNPLGLAICYTVMAGQLDPLIPFY